MKNVLFLFLMLGFLGVSFAQISQPGTPASRLYQMPAVQTSINLTPVNLDWQQIDAEDALQAAQNLPIRAGFSLDVNKTIDNSGEWTLLPNGKMMWRMKLEAQGAKALGLVFDRFYIPEGAELYVYDATHQVELGAFTSENNNPQGVFTTALIPGTEITIEYIETPEAGTISNLRKQGAIMKNGDVFAPQMSETVQTGTYHPKGVLSISQLIFNYNNPTFENFSNKDLGDSESCQVNINCSPEGDAWQVQKRGIARILFREGSSWYYCTGTLVNNTAQNATPYFLTAYHCGAVASAADHSVWQFYFNYERTGCANTGTPPTNMITGCTKRAEGDINGGTDMQLVELSSTPSSAWNVYYNGWDRSGTASPSGVAIHHPSGDAKKISTYSTTLTNGTWSDGTNTGMTNGHWRVSWASTTNGYGVSEGGSSGSPLFNNNKLVIGTLSGGSSTCAAPTNQDLYGKFSIHWEGNGSTNAYKLRPWLDPVGTNPTTLGGLDPNANTNPPVCDFVADRVNVVAGETVNFTDQSTNVPTSWAWTFTGSIPSTSTMRNPSCVWNVPGTYTVSLTATNAYGSNTKTRTAYITVTAYTTSTTNPVVVGTGTTTATYPLGVVRGYERSASIYTAAEIGRSGFLDSLSWYPTTARTVYRPLKIYVKHTTSTTLTAGTWASMISGATLIYDDSTTVPTANVWQAFPLKLNNFYYNGTDNLLVMVEQNKGVNSNQTTACRYSTATSKHEYWRNATTPISAPTGAGTVENNRPNIRLRFKTFATPVAQFTAGDGTVIMSENFDGTWLPTGWTVVNTHATKRWGQGNPSGATYNTIDAGNVYSAVVPWIAENQDEWLISPQVNTAAYAGRPLKIKFHLGFGRSYLSPGATLKFKISTNNGTSWTDLWNAIGDNTAPTGTAWAWRLLNIDLSSYAGQNLKFAWEYVGNDGDMMALDGVKIYIDEIPTQVNIYEGDYLQYTDLTTGNPMVWEWTLPGAASTISNAQNPKPQYNVAGTYNATLKAGNPKGEDIEAKSNFVVVTGRPPVADFWGLGNLTTIGYQPFNPPGATVNYYDFSTRVPTSWEWIFENGTPATSTSQNPTGITYSTTGTFDATLRAHNAHGHDTTTWTDFVVVGGTKFVTNLFPWDELTVYGMTSGFLPGHNNNTLTKYAEFFDNDYPGQITKVRMPIYKAQGTGKTINIVVWDGSTGTPGTVLGTQTFPITDFTEGRYDTATFTTPVSVTGDFFVGYEITYDATHNYTTHIFCPYMAVDRGAGQPTTAWAMYNSTWYLIDDLFGGLASAIAIEPEFTYNGAALPIVTATATPGCATGSVTITSNITANQTFYLLNNAGGTLQTWTGNTNTYTFTGLANGTYKGKTVNGAVTSPESSAVTLTNDATSVGGSISGTNTQICLGSASGTMTLSGNTGAVTKWQKRVNAGTWTDITNTALTYSETPSSAGTWEYVAVVKSGSCTEATSSAYTLIVDPTTVAGSVSGTSSSICIGSATGNLNLTGNIGTVVKWQKRVDAGTWTDISNTSTTYSETPSSAGVWEYRAVVQSGTCLVANSTSYSITVSPASVGGSVNGSSTNICLGSATGTLTLTGHTGTVTKWQKSNNGGTTWADITNTAITYSETPASAGTWLYRAVVQSGACSTANSSSYSITVAPASVGGSVSGTNTQVCVGSSTGTLTLSGYTGNITKWQKSNNGGSTWTDISNTTATHSETAGTAGTWLYRAVVQSGVCSSSNSSSFTITVDPATVAGSVNGTNTEICLGSNTGTLTLSGHTGTVTKWQKSNNGGSSWTDITNTAITFSETPASAGTWMYRAVVQSGTCSSLNSNSYSITVSPASVGGTVNGSSANICLGSSTGALTLSGHTGIITKWQKSNNGGTTWTDITNTSTTYSETPAVAGTWLYRAVVQSGSCSIANSASYSVVVSPTSVAGTLSGPNTEICRGASTGTLTLSGYTGTIVKWERSDDGGSTWMDLSNTANTYSEIPGIPGTRKYRVTVQSGSCSQSISNVFTIVIDPVTVAGSVGGTNTEICLGSSTGTLTLSGHTGVVTKWQKSNNGGTTWIDITNTAITYSETPASAGTWLYRAVVQSGICSSANSATYSITVSPASVGGSVSGSLSEICLGSGTGTLTLSGYTGNVLKWQKSNNGGTSWTDISNTTVTYNETPASAGTWMYRAQVQSGSCGAAFSSAYSIIVDPTTVGGTVSAGVTQIFLGASTGNITLASNTGAIVRWEKRLNSGSWTAIASTSNPFSEIPSAVGFWDYRAVVQSGNCSEAYSNSVQIEVLASSGGSVSGGSSPICLGSSTGTMTLSGYTGTIIRWQKSNNGGTIWTNITNTNTTYSETPVTAGTWLYRVELFTTVTVYSAPQTIVVNPTTVAGTVSGGTSICLGSSTGAMTLSGQTGSILKWQVSTDGGSSWSDIANTATTYSTTPVSVGTYEYRAIVQSGACSILNSTSTTVVVSPVTVAGSVSGGSTICAGTSTGTLTLSGNTGSVIKWQKQFNAGGWSDISNTNTTYSEVLSTAGVYEFRAVVQSGGCSQLNSGSTSVTVDATTVGGSVNGTNANICLGDNTGTLTLTGHTGTITKWQKSNNGGTSWTDISNTSVTYSETPASAGTWMYRAEVDNGACASQFATAFTINVGAISVGGSLSGNNTICAGSSTGIMTLTGYTGTIVKWQRSNNGGSTWTDISNTAATYSETLPIAGTYIYHVIIQNGSCATANSGNATIIVDQTTVAGSVSGTNSNICLGESTGTLTLGSYTGNILKWQKSNNGGSSWTDIVSTSATFAETPSAAGTWIYRAEIQSGSCSSAFSTGFSVNVNSLTVGGSLNGTSTICAGNNSGIMTISGFTGSIIKWQRSNDGGSNWSDISNTSSTYSEILNTAGTYIYRVVVQNGTCASAFSSTATITVDPATAAGAINGTSSNICLGSSTGTLTLSGHAGAILKWQKRVDAGSWNDISNTGTTYGEVPSSAGTWEYRAEIQSGSCGSVFSTPFSVIVNATSVGGSITGTSSICVNTSTGIMTLSGQTGAIIKWQKRYNSGTWTDIANTTTTHSEILTLAGYYEFRAEVSNGTCSSVYSAIASVTVDQASVAASLLPATGSICAGSTSPTLTASGYNGVIVKWQKQFNGGGWTDIANTNATYSEVLALQGTYEFRVVTRNNSCDEIASNIANISVSQGTVAGILSGGGEACSSGTFNLSLGTHTGTILDWEEYNGSSWVSLGNTTDTYTFNGTSSGTFKFRAIVQNGSCPMEYSNEEIVTIYDATQGGMIVNMTDSICVNENSGNFILTAYVGSILKWQKRIDGGAWTDIAFTDYTYSETPTTAGLYEYRAVVKNEICNEEYSDIKSLVVMNAPVASFTTSTDALDVTFTNTSTGATTYNWDFGDSQSSTLANPLHHYTTGGSYTVVLEASNGQCSSTHSEVVEVTVSIAEFSNGSSVVVYPNPSNGKFFLTIQSGNLNNVSLNTYDATGKLIMTTAIGKMNAATTIKVEIPSLAAGVYHMVLTADEGSAEYQMVVQ